MRDQDLLLLEVATTKSLDEHTANRAALEYRNISSFKNFATSALLQNTDLHLD